jgi:hypothetical protein
MSIYGKSEDPNYVPRLSSQISEALRQAQINGTLNVCADIAAMQCGLKKPAGEFDPLCCAYFIRFAYIESLNRKMLAMRTAEEAREEERMWKQAYDAAMLALTGKENAV